MRSNTIMRLLIGHNNLLGQLHVMGQIEDPTCSFYGGEDVSFFAL